jgi:hypothetical protein
MEEQAQMEERNKTVTQMEMLQAVGALVEQILVCQPQAQTVECDLSGNKTLDCN